MKPLLGPLRDDSVLWFSQGVQHVPPGDAWMTPRESQWAARMRFPKRHSEFRLGRFTAKRALGLCLGLPESAETMRRLEIGRAPDGAPDPRLDGRPVPVSLSMTDRADWACCALAPPDTGIGCDLELVEPRSAAFVEDFLTAGERSRLASAPAGEQDLLANLVWSGKEAALKVLRTGLRRDTRSVEVRFEPERAASWAPLQVRAVEGSTFDAWWRRYGPFVLTVAATRPTLPPVPLLEPPGLARA